MWMNHHHAPKAPQNNITRTNHQPVGHRADPRALPRGRVRFQSGQLRQKVLHVDAHDGVGLQPRLVPPERGRVQRGIEEELAGEPVPLGALLGHETEHDLEREEEVPNLCAWLGCACVGVEGVNIPTRTTNKKNRQRHERMHGRTA